MPKQQSNKRPEIIRLENVDKIYRFNKRNNRKNILKLFSKKEKSDKKALDNINISIKKGEKIALLGKNGCGKSTILKIISNVSFPTKGEVTVNGNVNALLELNSGFEPEFTGRENIYLKGTIMGLSRKEIKSIEQEIIDFADIGEYIDYPMRTYSSGMRARLGFSLAINIEPDILIVDEALSVGDNEFKKKCLDKVNEITSKENVTFLFVTHSFEMAKQFCDRGILLEQGKIIYDGPIEKTLEKYNNMLR